MWIKLGSFQIQPGEFAKIALLCFFAYYLVRKREVLSLASKRFLGIDFPRGRDLGPVVAVWIFSMLVLIFEKDQISIFIDARVAPGIVKQHQREQTGCFRGRRCHQRSHQPAETDCLHTKIGSHERTGSRRSVAFIEDEIDYGQYCLQPFVKVGRGRHHVWNARIVDFAFRPDEPLRHRRHRH